MSLPCLSMIMTMMSDGSLSPIPNSLLPENWHFSLAGSPAGGLNIKEILCAYNYDIDQISTFQNKSSTCYANEKQKRREAFIPDKYMSQLRTYIFEKWFISSRHTCGIGFWQNIGTPSRRHTEHIFFSIYFWLNWMPNNKGIQIQVNNKQHNLE